jgi:hypothetical protein
MRYLKETLDYKLVYGSGDKKVRNCLPHIQMLIMEGTRSMADPLVDMLLALVVLQ